MPFCTYLAYTPPSGYGQERELVAMNQEFAEEVKLLKRVIYKNKNQHRRLKYFQYLQMAVRMLKKLECAVISQQELKLKCTEMLARAKTGADIDMQLFQTTLEALVSAANLHQRASKYCIFAAERLSALVAKGWFLTFAVVTLASVCKCESYCRKSDEFVLEFQQFATMGLRRLRSVCLSGSNNTSNRNQLAVQITRIVLNARSMLDSTALLQLKETVKAKPQKRLMEDDDLGATVSRLSGETGSSKKKLKRGV